MKVLITTSLLVIVFAFCLNLYLNLFLIIFLGNTKWGILLLGLSIVSRIKKSAITLAKLMSA